MWRFTFSSVMLLLVLLLGIFLSLFYWETIIHIFCLKTWRKMFNILHLLHYFCYWRPQFCYTLSFFHYRFVQKFKVEIIWLWKSFEAIFIVFHPQEPGRKRVNQKNSSFYNLPILLLSTPISYLSFPFFCRFVESSNN